MGFLITKPTSPFLFITRMLSNYIFWSILIVPSLLVIALTQLLKLFKLSLKFSVKDLGVLHYFLGVEVIPKPWSISYPTKIPSRSF